MKKSLFGILLAACLSLPAAAQFDPATTGYSPTTGMSAPQVRYQLPSGMTPAEYHAVQNGAYYRQSGWRGNYYNPYNYYYNQGYYYNNGYADPHVIQQQQNYYRSYNNHPWNQAPPGMSPDTPGWREPSVFSR